MKKKNSDVFSSDLAHLKLENQKSSWNIKDLVSPDHTFEDIDGTL